MNNKTTNFTDSMFKSTLEIDDDFYTECQSDIDLGPVDVTTTSHQ